jgi:hypothetical protein
VVVDCAKAALPANKATATRENGVGDMGSLKGLPR